MYNPDKGDPSRLAFKLTRLEFGRVMGSYGFDFDSFVALHCAWGSEPLSIDGEGLYVLFATGHKREVAIAELGDIHPQRLALTDELLFTALIPHDNVKVFTSRLSKTIKALFPDFYDAQSLDHARAVIAKLDRRTPKPILKKPKPPLTRLSNERWWRKQTRPL